METQNDENKLIIELNFKFQMKDYRLKLVTKKGWILASILASIKIALIIYKSLSP